MGYTRTTSGLYLGTCEQCDCSGHSSDCDAETGDCQVSYGGRRLHLAGTCWGGMVCGACPSTELAPGGIRDSAEGSRGSGNC